MAARLDEGVELSGSRIFGGVVVHGIDPELGQPIWSCALANKIHVKSGAVDANGNVYLGGDFMGDMTLCNGSVLSHTGTGTNKDAFLLKFDASGTLLWKRNISASPPYASGLVAMALDPAGHLWYAAQGTQLSINRVDANGNDVEFRTMSGVMVVGGISFDPWGGLYVSGACSNNGLVIGGLAQVPVMAGLYNMFVCRFGPDGTGRWARFADDISFQDPVVVADAQGHAYLAGSLSDTTSWGGVSFNGPDWVNSTFLAKVDSSGQFLWGVESDPAGGPVAGDMQAGLNGCLAVDAVGNPYLTGIIRGSVEWGNGITSTAGSLTSYAQAIVAFDQNGIPQWTSTSGPSGNLFSQAISVSGDGNLYFSLHTTGVLSYPPFETGAASAQAYAIGRLDINATGTREVAPLMGTFAVPSPFTDSFVLTPRPGSGSLIRAYDASGRVVYTGGYRDGLGRDWRPGLYTLEVRSGDQRRTVRVAKE